MGQVPQSLTPRTNPQSQVNQGPDRSRYENKDDVFSTTLPISPSAQPGDHLKQVSPSPAQPARITSPETCPHPGTPRTRSKIAA